MTTHIIGIEKLKKPYKTRLEVYGLNRINYKKDTLGLNKPKNEFIQL